jgi:hypothetical protein
LGGRPHGSQVADDLSVVGTVQVKIAELLDGGVVEVDVHYDVVIGRTETLRSGAEFEQPVNRLRIPRLEQVL